MKTDIGEVRKGTAMKQKIQDAINDQINAELYSAYLYLSMASYMESINLMGFANWMKIQAQEEVTHAMRFYAYVNDRGGRALMKAIEKPETDWSSPLAAFEQTLEHERHVTDRINKLVDLATSESDHATLNMLQWFVSEQVEEEASADAIIQKLKLVGDSGPGLFMVDQELAARVFTPVADAGAGE
jgi:ferritin